jgi:hypothetical protein
MTEVIPHVLEMRRDVDAQGSRVFVVVTDLPVSPTSQGSMRKGVTTLDGQLATSRATASVNT